MSFEPILLFFLLRYLRRSVKDFIPNPKLEKWLIQAQYATVALVVLMIVLKIEEEGVLIFDVTLLFCIVLSLTRFEISHLKLLIYGIIPIVVLSFIDNFLQVFIPDFYDSAEKYLMFGYPAAVTWLIALLILSTKQKKAFIKERQQIAAEEERKRIEEERKAELEALVLERTQELMRQKEELKGALVALKETQAQLVQREKMASLGELTAGIAHEIQNPLNFINNFSEVSKELINELKEEQQNGSYAVITDQSLLKDIELNLDKIIFHGKRADAIVKSMLEHSRTSKGEMQPTDINALVDEYLRLSYHGMRAKNKSFNTMLDTHYDPNIGNINLVSQDLGRVLLNMFNNAFYSVAKKKNEAGDSYHPIVSVNTNKVNESVYITIRDNGMGINKDIQNKVFQPFFTTKPTGQGTGLGLSLSYEIISAHGGNIEVHSKEGEFAEFIIKLPSKPVDASV